MKDVVFELEELVSKLEDPEARGAFHMSLGRLKNRIEDAFITTENYEEMIGQLSAKNAEISKELMGLRCEAEQGFDYYPGPSSECAMCQKEFDGDMNMIAHGLCTVCKSKFDSLHPGARLSPAAKN